LKSVSRLWYTACMRSLFLWFFLCLLPLVAQAAPIVLIYESGGKKSDNAFIDMARQGLERARQELEVEGEEYALEPGEPRERALRRFADLKPELIIALGYQNVEAVAKVAAQYPATSFTVIDGKVPPVLSNVQSILFRDNEGAFLVGIIAAMQSKSGKIGFIGGMDVPVIRDFAIGYHQGAAYARKDVEILVEMIGKTSEAWSNPRRAAQLAQKQIAQGADVIFAAAGGSGVGMLEKVSHYKDVYSVGVDFNQNGLYPGSVLTSLVKRVDKAVYEAIRRRTDNSWSPGIQYFGIKEGALDYAVDLNNASMLPPEIIDAAERAKDYIMQGVIRVDRFRAK
jgi:basic membrane protein A and related proteins